MKNPERYENIQRAFDDVVSGFGKVCDWLGEAIEKTVEAVGDAIDFKFRVDYASKELEKLSQRIIDDECPEYTWVCEADDEEEDGIHNWTAGQFYEWQQRYGGGY